MTDMTAEQALEWLQTIAAISVAVVSDRPLSFSYQEAVKFQAAVKALTAPRVPEGWIDFVREVVESADGYESRSGNKVNGDWVPRGRALLAAATAPADYDNKAVAGEGDLAGVSLSDALRNYVRDEVRWPGDNTPTKSQAARDSELARLRERVKELEAQLEPAKQHPAPCEWNDGEPPNPYRYEWFIAKMKGGRTVVAQALPESYSYDYTTADETYFRADRITRWMQLPNSEFVSPAQYELAKLRERVKVLEGIVSDNHITIRKQHQALAFCESSAKGIVMQIVCIGGPLNDNKLQYSPQQLGIFHQINMLAAEIESAARLRGGSDE